MFLIETRKKAGEMQRLRNIGGMEHVVAVDCTGEGRSRGGGLACIWGSTVEVSLASMSLNHMMLEIKHVYEEESMWVTGIYGHPETSNKRKTWELIRSLTPPPETPWLCFGDFNEILSAGEKRGGNNFNFDGAKAFQETLDDCGLTDLGFFGYKYTWSNRRRAPDTIEERLDRATANDKWKQIWTSSEVNHLPRFRSDHNPIAISISKRKKQKKKKVRLYRFEESWLRSEDCEQIVKHSWPGSGGDITTKLGCVAANLTEWADIFIGSIPKRIKGLLADLKKLQATTQTENVRKMTLDKEKELEELLRMEEVMWSQRSRATWLAHGDRNTKFFHRKASQRQSRNQIERLKDDQGVVWREEDDIENVLTNYFQGLFTSTNPQNCEALTLLVGNRVTEEHRTWLDTPFIEEEVRMALNKCTLQNP